MRIAVCDDSSMDRELMMDLLDRYLAEKSIHYDVTQYEDGLNLVYDVEEGVWYDIVFLDAYMKDTLGIDVARKLRAMDYRGEIIFFTATSEFAVDSYEVEAAGYMVKPHSVEKLSMAMDRIIHHFDVDTYQVQQRSRVVRIPYSEILYVESSNSKCLVHRSDGTSYAIYKRLSQVEEELDDPRFLRCHQSYLVNMDCIEQADKQFILTSGDTVLIRQRDLKAIRQAYLCYVTGRLSKIL